MLDAGAGTGFTTEGIVARVDAARVTMLDQSPHQLARSRAKPALAACPRVLGDAENLPFGDDRFDRYVSAGSIEYWPDPQRGIAEAYRVTRAGGVALVIGPVRPANRVARRLAETWMLFPPAADYTRWMATAGFTDVRTRELAPGLVPRRPRALRARGQRRQAGRGPLARARVGSADERRPAALRFAARFVAGSAAGAAFVPIAAVLALRARREARRAA